MILLGALALVACACILLTLRTPPPRDTYFRDRVRVWLHEVSAEWKDK